MDRRIYGIETEYGLTSTDGGRPVLSPDEAARYMFRSVVAENRSSNVFLNNGARLYLDVGNHPEYATAECDTLPDLLAQERAGDAIMHDLVVQAERRLAAEDVRADIYLFKNNLDSAGNSFGCHENYLLGRDTELAAVTAQLLPFLVSRQLICGAGKVLTGADGAPHYVLSQRAGVMWEGASSATTRSRPMINTRDEPHADAEKFRRLHVIVGDSNLSQTSTLLKVGTTDLVLRAMEARVGVPDLTPAVQAQAIREFSRDLTGRATVATTRGQQVSALDIQRAFHERVAGHLAEVGPTRPLDEDVFALWTTVLDALESGESAPLETTIDWAIKKRLIDRQLDRLGCELGDPRIAQLELLYHDIHPGRGLFLRLEAAGVVRTVLDPEQVATARALPPQTTRARLRGEFVTAARAHGRDYTVDWSHLRLNDEPARTLLCKDPFLAVDERVSRMIAGIDASGGAPRGH